MLLALCCSCCCCCCSNLYGATETIQMKYHILSRCVDDDDLVNGLCLLIALLLSKKVVIVSLSGSVLECLHVDVSVCVCEWEFAYVNSMEKRIHALSTTIWISALDGATSTRNTQISSRFFSFKKIIFYLFGRSNLILICDEFQVKTTRRCL